MDDDTNNNSVTRIDPHDQLSSEDDTALKASHRHFQSHLGKMHDTTTEDVAAATGHIKHNVDKKECGGDGGSTSRTARIIRRWSHSPVMQSMLTCNLMHDCDDVLTIYKQCQESDSDSVICEAAERYYHMCFPHGRQDEEIVTAGGHV